MLQGVPIGAPVVQRGPLVASTEDELRQAFLDYRQTQFGGWPWPSHEETFPRDQARFARFPDGSEELPGEVGPA